jgi:DNA-binding transcriptional LysR family regulator
MRSRTARVGAAVCFQDAAAPRREHDGLRRVDLVEEPMLAILVATHPLARRRRIALRELADEPWMAPSTDGILVDACRAAGFEPRIVIHTRDPLAARTIAAAGLAVSLTPRLLARIRLPGVTTPELRGDAPHRTLDAILPTTGAHPLADGLINALATAATTSRSVRHTN